MDPRDLEIRRRLDKLKEPLLDVPSKEELESRLRELKGLPAASNISNKYVVLPKIQSQTEQVDDLLRQYSEEVALSSRGSTSVPIDDIERRLRNLKADNFSQENRVEIPQDSDNKILLKKILAEANLEKKLENEFPNLISSSEEISTVNEKMSCSESDSESEDEFCSICDKSPKWICRDCDKDMFCSNCFDEFHDNIGENHRRKVYNRRKR